MILIVSLQEDDGKKHTFNIVSRKLAISQRADNFINDVMDQGLCTKKGMNQKSWAHLISVVVCGFRESLVD